MQMRVETRAAVPEPASIILMLTGLVILLAFRQNSTLAAVKFDKGPARAAIFRRKSTMQTFLSKQALLSFLRTGIALIFCLAAA